MSESDPRPSVHVLEIPLVWFLLQSAEYVVLVLILEIAIPDGWPRSITYGLALVLLVALVLVNYRVRRRYLPH